MTGHLPSAWSDIEWLALSLDGYAAAGSPAAANEIATTVHAAFTTRGPDGLVEITTAHLRIALFLLQRSMRHVGGRPDEPTMRFVQAIVSELAKREGVDWVWERLEARRKGTLS